VDWHLQREQTAAAQGGRRIAKGAGWSLIGTTRLTLRHPFVGDIIVMRYQHGNR
jgi:hypothetical protein